MTVMTTRDTNAGNAVGGRGAECRGQEIGDAVAHQLVGQQRPAEDDTEHKQIEIESSRDPRRSTGS